MNCFRMHLVLLALILVGNVSAAECHCPDKVAYFDALWVPQDSLIKANGVRWMEDYTDSAFVNCERHFDEEGRIIQAKYFSYSFFSLIKRIRYQMDFKYSQSGQLVCVEHNERGSDWTTIDSLYYWNDNLLFQSDYQINKKDGRNTYYPLSLVFDSLSERIYLDAIKSSNPYWKILPDGMLDYNHYCYADSMKCATDSILTQVDSNGVEHIRTFHKFKDNNYTLLAHKTNEYDSLGRIMSCKCLTGNRNFGNSARFKYFEGHLVEAFFDDKRVIYKYGDDGLLKRSTSTYENPHGKPWFNVYKYYYSTKD